MALSDKSKRISGFVTLKDWDSEKLSHFSEALKDFLNNGLGAVRWAFILHALDVNESGERKSPHFHFWVECKSSSRISTYINKFAKALEVSPLAVTLSVCVSSEGAIQYLIHKNDPDKYQYDICEVRSNIDREELALIMERPIEAFSVDFIITSYQGSKNMAEFVKKIGIERYQKYRYVIKDLLEGMRR